MWWTLYLSLQPPFSALCYQNLSTGTWSTVTTTTRKRAGIYKNLKLNYSHSRKNNYSQQGPWASKETWSRKSRCSINKSNHNTLRWWEESPELDSWLPDLWWARSVWWTSIMLEFRSLVSPSSLWVLSLTWLTTVWKVKTTLNALWLSSLCWATCP